MIVEIDKAIEKFSKVVPSSQVEQVIETARNLDVSTPEGARYASKLLSDCAALSERVESFWEPIEKAAYSTWKAIKAAADRFRNVFSSESPYKQKPENIRGIIEQKVLELGYIPEGAEGMTLRSVRQAEVTDLKALVRACLSGKAPLELIEPNMKKLNELARSFSDSPFPGVQFTERKALVFKNGKH